MTNMPSQYNYGGLDIADNALQITTGLYPTTGGPLDVRLTIEDSYILSTHTPVGLQLYTGITLYALNTDEQISVVGLKQGRSGVYWDDWEFSTIIAAFKRDIDIAASTDQMYSSIVPNNYSIQNLLNYLYLRSKKIDTVTLTIRYIYSGTVEPFSTVTETYTVGQQYSVTPQEITGYEYSVTGGNLQGTITEDMTLTVTYSKKSYTITYWLDSEKTNMYDREYYNWNDPVTMPENPDDPTLQHRQFDGWIFTPSLTNGLMPASDVDAVAQWGLPTIYYTVTLSSNDQSYGTVTQSGSGSYESNTTVTVYATPNTGYRFVCWKSGLYGDIISENPTYSFTIERNTILFAVFADIHVSVTTRTNTVPSSPGCTITPVLNAVQKLPDDQIHLYVESIAMNYVVDGWYEYLDGSSTGTLISSEGDYTYTVPSGHSTVVLEAKFVREVEVTANVSGSATVTINGRSATSDSVPVNYGSKMTIEVIPTDPGAHIDSNGWTLSPSLPYSLSNNNTTLTVESVDTTNPITVSVIIRSGEVKILAFASPTELSNRDLGVVDYSSVDTFVYVPSNDTSSTYGVSLSKAQTDNTYTWIVVAIPSGFECHDTDEFFGAEGPGYGTSYIPAEHCKLNVSIDDTLYNVFECERRDISASTGNDVKLLFGNWTDGVWSDQWNDTYENGRRIELSGTE